MARFLRVPRQQERPLTNQDFSIARRSILRKPLAEALSLRDRRAAPAPVAPVAAKVETSAHEPRDILNSIGAVVYDWDLTTDRLHWGANFKDVLGQFPGEALERGDSFADLIADNSESSRYHAIFHSALPPNEEGTPYRAQYGLIAEGRQVIAVEDFGRWFADSSGRPARAHGVLRIIPDPAKRDGLSEVSRRDPLTGAVGRGRLIEHINAQATEIARRGAQFAVLIVGVDRLQAINERYGYDVADAALVAVARRLYDCVRATDLVARYVGGRFALVLESCDAEQCALLSRRILRAAKEPIRIDGREVRLSLRIGAALAPKHGRTAQALLQRAEEAHDFASRDRGGVTIYAPALASRSAEARASSVSDEIVAALNDRRIVLAYQLVSPVRADRPPYYEALLRVRDGNGAFLGPSAILPVAERVGLIGQLDQRVLELALKRMSVKPNLRLSINASPSTMLEADWIGDFANALAAHPGAARRLILEVTESQAITDLDRTAQLFAQVRALGVKVAMDDFGAGHTSFRNLRGLGVDIVKIDGAFVQNIARSADDRFFVRTLLELARNLGLETVAEWVEDAEAARILGDWGVDYLQGHHFGAAETHEEPAEEPMLARAVG
jgi:diguanylate cyclase (GGDEF)-like protein